MQILPPRKLSFGAAFSFQEAGSRWADEEAAR